jgi:hypothetical protein
VTPGLPGLDGLPGWLGRIFLALLDTSAPVWPFALPFSAPSDTLPALGLTNDLRLAALLILMPFCFPPSWVVPMLLIPAPVWAASGEVFSTTGISFWGFFSACPKAKVAENRSMNNKIVLFMYQ